MNPQTEQVSSLATAYTCKICRQTLSLSGPPIIGEDPMQTFVRLTEMLAQHVGQKHQHEATMIQGAGEQFKGWLLWEQFRHNNAEMARHGNDIRIRTRQFTKRVNISDELITKQVDAHIGPIAQDGFPERDAIITLLKTMRDSMEEIQA